MRCSKHARLLVAAMSILHGLSVPVRAGTGTRGRLIDACTWGKNRLSAAYACARERPVKTLLGLTAVGAAGLVTLYPKENRAEGRAPFHPQVCDVFSATFGAPASLMQAFCQVMAGLSPWTLGAVSGVYALSHQSFRLRQKEKALANENSRLNQMVDNLEAERRRLLAEKNILEGAHNRLLAANTRLEGEGNRLRDEKNTLKNRNSRLLAKNEALETANRALRRARDREGDRTRLPSLLGSPRNMP